MQRLFNMSFSRLQRSALYFFCIVAKLSSTAHASEKTAFIFPDKNWYKKNLKLFNEGKFASIIKNLDAVQFDAKNEAQRKFILARTYAKLKQYKKAALYAEESYSIDSNLKTAKFNQACYLTLAGDLKSAFLAISVLDETLMDAEKTERTTFSKALREDPDLHALRSDRTFGNEMATIAKKLLETPVILVNFEGCGRKDKNGTLIEIKNYDCQSFDGSTFSGSATSCPEKWVQITQQVPRSMTQNLEGCMYEL